VPDAVDSVQAASFAVLNETSSRLPVETVEFTGDSLRLSVDGTALVALTEHSDIIQLYGTYLTRHTREVTRPQRGRSRVGPRCGLCTQN
jgi:hypothetical protein